MVGHQPALAAVGQHGAFDLSIGLFAGAQPQLRMHAGAQQGDVRAVALATTPVAPPAKQPLARIPLAAKRDQVDLRRCRSGTARYPAKR